MYYVILSKLENSQKIRKSLIAIDNIKYSKVINNYSHILQQQQQQNMKKYLYCWQNLKKIKFKKIKLRIKKCVNFN